MTASFDKYLLWSLNHAAVAAADRAWEAGHLDFTEMEAYLSGLLQAQLENS